MESIYEPLFSNDSYGFRPKRGCHDAIKALYDHLIKHEVEAVIDVDISNYFGSIPQDLVMEIIGKKISDPRILRYLIRMFKAGMLVDGELQRSDEGLVQGSACSPIIANIFAHEVIDTWIETTVKPHCKGEVKMVRYADDIVICCRYEQDAERIQKALGQRLSKYGLKMNEEKTKLVGFSRRKQRSGTQQESFNFLGFTFYIGESRNGFSIVKMKTEGRRFSSKLKKVNDWARTCRNKMPQAKLMKLACSKLMGHIQYYGISHNYRQVDNFVYKVTVILFKWLNRRSQRKSFSWDKFRAYLELMNFPKAKICHRLF